MAWIFQGNPNRFDIDDYLSRYTQLIYWRTNRYVKDVSVGDPVFMWRSGAEAGVIAVGQIVEAPTPANEVKHPEVLREDLWVNDEAEPDELKTGIQISEIRLTVEEGMIVRSVVASDPVLATSAIIKARTGTVFRLSADQSVALERLWGSPLGTAKAAAATEGQRQLRSHYVRERSSRLRRDKLVAFRKEHGKLFCEVCGFDASANQPEPFTDRAYEVHHNLPLAAAVSPARTTLQDLSVLCANCHRAVHASSDVTENFRELGKWYTNRR